MSSSLSSELVARLSHQLDQYAASLTVVAADTSSSSGARTPSEDDEDEDFNAANARSGRGTSSDDERKSVDDELAALTSTLSRLRHAHTSSSGLSIDRVRAQAQEASRVQQALAIAATASGRLNAQSSSVRASSASHEQGSQLRWITNSHLALLAWGAVLKSLLDQAEAVKNEEAYWQSVEGEDASGLMYLIQTMPVRAANALRVLLGRLRLIAAAPRPPKSLFSYQAVKRALPPSLLITSLFPHLSQRGEKQGDHFSTSSASSSTASRSLLFLTFSPLLLTRQEVAHKRRKLQSMRQELAQRVGGFVKDAEKASEALRQQQEALSSSAQSSMKGIGDIMGERIAFIEASLADPPKLEGDHLQVFACQPRAPSDLLASVQSVLYQSAPTNVSKFSNQLQAVRKPSWLTRAWPWLLVTPVAGYYLSTKLYNSRQSIQDYFTMAKETVRGFLVDWVVDPCLRILATLRHGDSSLALMGRESLHSDFDVSGSHHVVSSHPTAPGQGPSAASADAQTTAHVLQEAMRSNLRLALYFQSLERMVADFAKDLKLAPEEIARVVQRVREGDMTLVLGAYENDLKSPLKNAITGNLVRTLLIQVQKVKVDVDVAMDGIEKMLKSQQLTFAFVGVAPSMVLLYLITNWLRGLFRTGPSRSTKWYKKRVWYSMRAIDRILTASLDSTSNPKVLDNVSTGSLLIELTTLRSYIASSAFPTRDRSVKSAFLDDIRELEKGGTGLDAKIRVFDRITRTFKVYLR